MSVSGARFADLLEQQRIDFSAGVPCSLIEDLIARARGAGATAAKVCGAGGGGCLFAFGPPDATPRIREALAAGGARLIDFTFERHGLSRG